MHRVQGKGYPGTLNDRIIYLKRRAGLATSNCIITLIIVHLTSASLAAPLPYDLCKMQLH